MVIVLALFDSFVVFNVSHLLLDRDLLIAELYNLYFPIPISFVARSSESTMALHRVLFGTRILLAKSLLLRTRIIERRPSSPFLLLAKHVSLGFMDISFLGLNFFEYLGELLVPLVILFILLKFFLDPFCKFDRSFHKIWVRGIKMLWIIEIIFLQWLQTVLYRYAGIII